MYLDAYGEDFPLLAHFWSDEVVSEHPPRPITADRAGTRLPWDLLILSLVALVVGCASGCRGLVGETRPVPAVARHDLVPTPPQSNFDPLSAAKRLVHEGRKLERQRDDTAVDRYYAAAVYACAGINSPDIDRADKARALHNEALADALRAARCLGRIDPRSHLLINGPTGAMSVPISHLGFVWKSSDFNRLLDPRDAPRDMPNKRPHCRRGLGSPVVVARCNPKQTAADQFLTDESFFPATAVLRPDLDAWLGRSPRAPVDRLELHDPYKVRRVNVVPGLPETWTLAADFDASFQYSLEAFNRGRPFALTGLFSPETLLSNTKINFPEPYQPGKIPLLLIHGLNSDQYTFTDFATELRLRPGFDEHYQIAYFNYPTGIPFLRSAAILRQQLRAVSTTFDPDGRDPALRQSVLVGYSMGGLLARSMTISSGDSFWNLWSQVPIDQIRTTENNRDFIREVLYFEPVPTVRRVIYVATPHEGSNLAGQSLGRVTRTFVQPPEDVRQLYRELKANNPGAMTELSSKPLTSIDLLIEGGPILKAMDRAPRAPDVPYHTILGTAHPGLTGPKGDFIVPIQSAAIPTAESTLAVTAGHLNIVPNRCTIAEVARILQEHLLVIGK